MTFFGAIWNTLLCGLRGGRGGGGSLSAHRFRAEGGQEGRWVGSPEGGRPLTPTPARCRDRGDKRRFC